MNPTFIVDLGVLFIAATVLAYIASAFRQPLIPAYIIAGIIIGPIGLGLISNPQDIGTLAELGIAFLLFITGMEIEPRLLKNMGAFTAIGGLLQGAVTFVMGFAIGTFYNFGYLPSIYLGLIATFSSTMVVVKLLSDKNELSTLHGRIMVGFLLMEDVMAVLALSLLGSLGNLDVAHIGFALIKGLGLISMAIVSAKYVLPTIFRFAAKSQELLFLTAVAMMLFFSWLSMNLGFSIAIGGFVAGLGLAAFPYNLEIIGRVRSLRDFFATMFFVALGLQFQLTGLEGMLMPAVLLILSVIVIGPLARMILCDVYGYEIRTSFLVAGGMAQVSEFGLIIAMFGYSMGHIGLPVFTLTTIVALVTITMTSYFLEYDQEIYARVAKLLTHVIKISPRKRKRKEAVEPTQLKDHIVIFGFGRAGKRVVNALRGQNLIVVDYDPELIKELMVEKIPCMYGDMGNIEVLHRLNLPAARMVISTVPSEDDNLLLLEVAKGPIVIARAHSIEDALSLYDAGADYVIMPTFLSGEIIGQYVTKYFHKRMDLRELKHRHIRELKKEYEREILDRFGKI
ncbi:MAG: cation:proton antiporter [archaeon]